jgi:hypothetical protein
MQKIRFNSVIRTSLPLPGPSLGNNSAFPQEAYFEITILNSHIANYTLQLDPKHKIFNLVLKHSFLNSVEHH